MRRRAQELYWNATRAERVLFEAIRRALPHKRVILQHPVSGVFTGHAIIDIAILPDKIGIEVDGRHHSLPLVALHDRWRTFQLGLGGWHIVRIANRVALTDTSAAVQEVLAALRKRSGPDSVSSTLP